MIIHCYGRSQGDKAGQPIEADYLVMVRPVQFRRSEDWGYTISASPSTAPGQFSWAHEHQYSVRCHSEAEAVAGGINVAKLEAGKLAEHPIFPRQLKLLFWKNGTHGVLWDARTNTEEEIE